MATTFTKDVTRVMPVKGVDAKVTITATGIEITPKGKQKSVVFRYDDLIDARAEELSNRGGDSEAREELAFIRGAGMTDKTMKRG